MATKEELNRIFEDALQQEEAAIKNPAPAASPAVSTSTPAPKSVSVQVAAPAIEAESESAPATETKTEHASVNETNPEFGALLEEREGRINKRRGHSKWAVNLLFLGLLGGTATAFAVSSELRGKAQHLVVSLKEGVDDVKMMGKGSENYDEALEEVAQRGNQIDAAARAIGVDPSTVDPGDDPNMLAEMNVLAGEDLGIDKRLGQLQTLGNVGQSITGADGPKTKEDFAAAAQDGAADVDAPTL
ncbi:hypothetical protein [Haloferula sp.]|uniref:hypothetical protein n=1 Tax=Haloferula sp. TaxID=2497595 RepID=UPI00329FAE69